MNTPESAAAGPVRGAPTHGDTSPVTGGARPPASPAKRIVTVLVGVAVLALVFGVAIPRFANYGAVWREIRTISPGWLVVIGALAILNLVTYAPNWMVALPGLGFRQSTELNMAGTAVANVAPLGGAVSMTMQYAMLREWGYARRDSSRAMVLTGIWNNFVNLALPIIGVGVLTLKGGRNAALMATARIGFVVLAVGVALFVMVLRSEQGAARGGRWWDRTFSALRRLLGKGPVTGAGVALARFRVDSLSLLKRRWVALTIATMMGVLTMYLLLVACIRAVGIDHTQITFTEAFAAWSAARLLGSIPLTPGGLGVIEVGLTGAMVAFGADDAGAVGAVLLYRILTWLPPVVLGALAAFTWRKHEALGSAP